MTNVQFGLRFHSLDCVVSEWAGYKVAVAVTQSIPARSHDCRSVTADCQPALHNSKPTLKQTPQKYKGKFPTVNWAEELISKLISSALGLSWLNVPAVLQEQLTRPVLTQAHVRFTATFCNCTHLEYIIVVLFTEFSTP